MRLILPGVALLVALPAAAAERVIPFKPDEAYRHKPSGLEVPATLDGVPRKQAASYSVEQLDDAVQFESSDGAQTITVYVFRNVTGSVPVWFDRIRAAIGQAGNSFGEVTPIDAPAPFVPPNQSNPSALMQSFITGKGPWRGTGAALIPLGADWYVALRYSSRTLSAAAIAEHLPKIAAALAWPGKIVARPSAELIASCAAPLAVSAKARQLPADFGAAILGSTLMTMVQEKQTKAAETAPVRWCRDATTVGSNASVYRTLYSTDAYLIAVGDAGRGIWVGPDTLGTIIEKSDHPRWSLSFIDMERSLVFAPFDALPSPADAAKAAETGKPLSAASTWGDKKSITIMPDAIKK